MSLWGMVVLPVIIHCLGFRSDLASGKVESERLRIGCLVGITLVEEIRKGEKGRTWVRLVLFSTVSTP